MTTPKLSKTQKGVVKLMREGWEIGHRKGFDPSAWIQEGKIGHGGRSKSMLLSTYVALCNAGIIEKCRDGYPSDAYTLTALGREIEIK